MGNRFKMVGKWDICGLEMQNFVLTPFARITCKKN